LHISLSRSLSVPTDQRDIVLSSVTRAIRASGVKEFTVKLGPSLSWVANYDKTRWFLAARAEPRESDGNELNKLLWACNSAVGDLGFDTLYMPKGQEKEQLDRSNFFHFSLAWCLASLAQTRNLSQDILDDAWQRKDADEVRQLTMLVDTVLMKVGNAVHAISLGSGRIADTKKGTPAIIM
jgi:U6 snRNA phosphodiesterase